MNKMINNDAFTKSDVIDYLRSYAEEATIDQ